MKISFEINVQAKKVTFFVKRGELYKWVEDAVAKFPELGTDALSMKGSDYLGAVLTRVMKDVCEANHVQDWQNFIPDFVTYRSEPDLNRRRMSTIQFQD